MLHMTTQGSQRFLDWLDTPNGGSVHAIRMEFVTRLYFLRIYMPEKISQAFDQQRVEATNDLHRLEKTYGDLPSEQIYNRMSLEMRLNQLKAVLDWLDNCQQYFSR